jgi:hypothetical protein
MTKQSKIVLAIVVAVALIGASLAGLFYPRPEGAQIGVRGVTNFDSLHLSDAGATATPVLRVNQTGAGAVVEFLDGGTPVFEIANGGDIAYTGDQTITGNLDVDGYSVLTVPTSVATSQPALVVDTESGLSNIFEVRDAATPVAYIEAGGNTSFLGGLVDIGGGTGGTADGDNDLLVAADAEVDGILRVDGAVDLNAGGAVDGACLNIGGGTPASCGDNDAYVAGDFEVDAALDVDGTVDVDGSTVDIDLTAGFSIDGDTASNISLSAQDLTIEAETGSIIIKADEAAADGLLLDLDEAAGTGLDIDVGATNGVSIDGGMLDVGTCTAGTASGDNDACIAGVLEVDGELELDGALDADSTSDFADTATFSKGSGSAIAISAGGDIDLPATADINAYGFVTVGDGTPDGDVAAGTDEELYVEGDVEVDGILNADGAINADSTLDVDGTATFAGAVALTQVNGAGASANPLDWTGTLGIMDGSDLFEAIDLNITGAAHTGNGNIVTGIDIDMTTADAQVPATAINVTDTTFDYAIQAGDSTIMSTAQTWFEDFLGDTIADEIIDLSGTDPQAVKAVGSEQYGILELTSGDDGANCAADCEAVTLGLHWQADQGALIFETRAHVDTNLTNTIICLGLSDNAGLEMPFTIGGSDVVTSVASDAVAFCYDSAGDTDEWFALGVAGDTDATGQGATGVAIVADTDQVLRIEVDIAGADARFYIDGTLVKSLTANAITVTDPLTPFAVVDTNAAGSVIADIDYLFVSSQRQ